jgi:nitronate monooxygenase
VQLSGAFTGLPTSMLRPSVVAAGLDPDKLDEHTTPELAREKFGAARASFEQAGAAYPAPQRWKDIWSAGHSVSGVTSIQPVVQLIESTRQEYHAAMRRSLGQIEATGAQSPAAPLAEVDCLRGEKI